MVQTRTSVGSPEGKNNVGVLLSAGSGIENDPNSISASCTNWDEALSGTLSKPSAG